MLILLRWLINALALLLLTRILDGFEVDNFYIALIAALIIGLLNAVIRPIIVLLTLPINILTLGLFTFVINAAILWFVSTFISGFSINSFLTALIAAIGLWIVSVLTNRFIDSAKKN